MRFTQLLLLFVSLAASLAFWEQFLLPTDWDSALDGVHDALKGAAIIPDILPDFRPRCFVALTYARAHDRVRLGNTIEPSHVQKEPVVRIICPNADDDSTANPAAEGPFTIALTDPDAPSRDEPKWSEFCHWISTVEPRSRSHHHKGGLKDIIEYKPPAPPAKTGPHRYIFVLLQGPNSNLTAPEDRKHWGTNKKGYGIRYWAEKEGLKVIGANFFYSQNKKQ